MTDPIKLQRAEFRNHFKQELKELKRMNKGGDEVRLLKGPVELAEELRNVMKALAEDQETITIGDHTYKRSDLKQRDLKPLMKLANEFFSTQRDGLLDNSLLENLMAIEKKYSHSRLGTLVERTEAALNMNNVSNLTVNETDAIRDVKGKIDETNKQIEKAEKMRKKAKIILVASAVGTAIGLGLFIGGMAAVTGGLIIPLIIIGANLMIFSSLGALLSRNYPSGLLVLKRIFFPLLQLQPLPSNVPRPVELDDAKKNHSYWTHVLTFSQTEEFQRFKQMNEGIEGLNTNSIDFLEAAALVRLESQNSLYRTNGSGATQARLKQLKQNLGADFQRQSLLYINSKTEKKELK